MKDIQPLIEEFLRALEQGRNLESSIVALRNKKFNLVKEAGNGRGLYDVAFRLDEGHPGDVLQDRRKDLQEIVDVLKKIKAANETLLRLFEREIKFDNSEIAELKKASSEITQNERELVDFYKRSSSRIGLSERESAILLKTHALAESEHKEKRQLLAALGIIQSVDSIFISFKKFLENQLSHCNLVLAAAENLFSALVGGEEEKRQDLVVIKNGIKNLLAEFREELGHYLVLGRNIVARNKILGELKSYDDVRKALEKDIISSQKGKLRVLIVPCNWGFGPVSKAISIVKSLKSMENVLDEVAVMATDDICKAAKRGFPRIKKYAISESQSYDRMKATDSYAAFQTRVSNFIAYFHKIVSEFKPNLVIDSLGYLGAPLAKNLGIPVIKLDHLFPELTKNEKAQKLGADLLQVYSNKDPRFRQFLIQYAYIRAFQWMGDVIADYLIVPAFYDIAITPSVVRYRGNKNIFFVNPCMDAQARLLMDDVFEVKSRMSRIVSRFGRRPGKENQFTKFILVSTGGVFNFDEYKEGWDVFVRHITALVKAVVELNNKYKSEKKPEFVGVVLVGSLSASQKFLDYMESKWTKEMVDCVVIGGKLRFYNTIRMYLSADVVVTNAGQTSISELITLNRPFLLLPPYQTEMIRNFEFIVKNGLGLPLSSYIAKDGSPTPDFLTMLTDLMDLNSHTNTAIRKKQQAVFQSLQNTDEILAAIISEIIGRKVSYKKGTPQEIVEISKPTDKKIEWNKKISVVIPLMDKDPQFLDNCLYKLRKAEPSSEKVEIIVIDFESQKKYYIDYERLCSQYDASIHLIAKRGRLWNGALVRNYGARIAKGDYIAWCDVDILVPTYIFERVKSILIKNPKALVIGRVFYDLKFRQPGFYKGLTDAQMKEIVIKERFTFNPRGWSGFIISDKEWVYESRGFDESYPYWGGEDYDFWYRSVSVKGKPLKYLDNFGHVTLQEYQKELLKKKMWLVPSLNENDVVIIHQTHHPAYTNPDPRIQEILRLKELRKQNAKKRRVISVNSDNWGTNKIKVLRMVSDFIVGGVADITLEQCKAMINDGSFDVRLIVAKPFYEPKYVDYLTKIGVEVRIADRVYSPQEIGKFCEDEIIDFKPEILIITNLREAASNIRKLKEIFTEMKVIFRISSSAGVGMAYASLYLWADVFICQSKGQADKFAENLKGFDKRKGFVLGNGVSEKFFEIQPSNKNRVCIVARTDPAKGLVSFVNIINEVKKQVPAVEGIIIGGPYEKDPASVACYKLVLQRIKETGAPVTFTGIVDQDHVIKYISQCKVLLFTSIREGFPSGFWQGVAAGLIPVTTSAGNIGEELKGKNQVFLSETPISDNIHNRLPEEVEADLTKKCITALRMSPDIKKIKQLAIRYKMSIWSERFIGLLKNLVGLENKVRWDYDEILPENGSKNRKVKVLRLVPSLIVGGLEITAMKECEVMAANDFEVTLLVASPNYSEEFVEHMQKVGVNVITNNNFTREDWLKACHEFILKNKPDIILISGLSFLANEIRKLRQILTDTKVVYRITSSHRHAIEIAKAYMWVDFMIALHPSLAELLKKEIPNLKVVAILGNPIQDIFFKIYPNKGNTICMTTRISPEKCLVSFVNIINEIRKEIPDVKGIIIGGANDLPESKNSLRLVEQKIRETNAPVEITGFTDEVTKYLSQSKIYLSTSSTEGFQNGFWEGVAAGLIPVATPVGNIPDILPGKKDAYICSINVDDTMKNQLPREAELDLAKKCVQALKSAPDIGSIKKMAMPFHYNIWSKEFVDIIDYCMNS